MKNIFFFASMATARSSAVWLLLFLFSAGVSAAEIAGRLQFVAGNVNLVKPDGASRVASKGEAVIEGESIATGKDAQAQILMSDQALIAVRPDTLLKIETYRYSGKENENDRSFLGLLRGGFRAITGQIGRFNHSAYQVRTPNATIGIRGTDHEPFYIPPPLPGQTALGTPGTYDKVNAGGTILQTQGGSVELGPNQVGFVAQQIGAMPQKLPEIPNFLRTASVPPPKAATAPSPATASRTSAVNQTPMATDASVSSAGSDAGQNRMDAASAGQKASTGTAAAGASVASPDGVGRSSTGTPFVTSATLPVGTVSQGMTMSDSKQSAAQSVTQFRDISSTTLALPLPAVSAGQMSDRTMPIGTQINAATLPATATQPVIKDVRVQVPNSTQTLSVGTSAADQVQKVCTSDGSGMLRCN